MIGMKKRRRVNAPEWLEKMCRCSVCNKILRLSESKKFVTCEDSSHVGLIPTVDFGKQIADKAVAIGDASKPAVCVRKAWLFIRIHQQAEVARDDRRMRERTPVNARASGKDREADLFGMLEGEQGTGIAQKG